jgi:hypothetical protein
MAQDELEVSIMDGPTLIQRWVCAGTTLPDGRPGAVWRGVAYPLSPGNLIDVSAQSAEGASAPLFVVLPGDENTWVLLQGLPAKRAEVQAALEHMGISVLRAGRWLGEPVENHAYDWFICCVGTISQQQISAVLGGGAEIEHAPQVRLGILEQRIADLRAELAERDAALQRWSRMSAADASSSEGRLAPAFEEAQTTLSTTLPDLSSRPAERVERTKTSLRTQDEIGMILNVLRPDVTLLRDSLLVAIGEFASRASFYRAIQDLRPEGGRPEGWKSLRGAERWWERHVSTGQDDSGRIYARFDTTSRKWCLLLGWKVEQARDIEWLRRLI